MIPAKILDLISSELGVDVKDRFDLIVGCSGGGILALWVAQGYNREEGHQLVDIFSQDKLKKMLDKSYWDYVMGEVQFQPVYDGQGKAQVMKQYFGNAVMSDVAKPVAVPVYNISKGTPEIFTSYSEHSSRALVREVANATSAAVPYFPAARIRLSNKKDLYADGGFAANDPIMASMTEARELFGPHVPLRILSLGTGILPGDEDLKSEEVENWGAIPWICNGLLDIVMRAPNALNRSLAQRLLTVESKDNRLLHLDVPIPRVKMDDTDPETVQMLQDKAHEVFEARRQDLVDFFKPSSSRAWACGPRNFHPV